jgi:hypothetical protein
MPAYTGKARGGMERYGGVSSQEKALIIKRANNSVFSRRTLTHLYDALSAKLFQTRQAQTSIFERP